MLQRIECAMPGAHETPAHNMRADVSLPSSCTHLSDCRIKSLCNDRSSRILDRNTNTICVRSPGLPPEDIATAVVSQDDLGSIGTVDIKPIAIRFDTSFATCCQGNRFAGFISRLPSCAEYRNTKRRCRRLPFNFHRSHLVDYPVPCIDDIHANAIGTRRCRLPSENITESIIPQDNF